MMENGKLVLWDMCPCLVKNDFSNARIRNAESDSQLMMSKSTSGIQSADFAHDIVSQFSLTVSLAL